MSIVIDSYNFRIGSKNTTGRIINISKTDAEYLFNKLQDACIFSPVTISVDLTTSIEIICDVKINKDNYVKMHLLELKELYYELFKIFAKPTATPR